MAAAFFGSALPPGPDALRFADEQRCRDLLAGWDDVAVDRVRWVVDVEPGAWFDAVAAGTPRTGTLLAQAGPEQRAQARERYVALARERYGTGDGRVALPATAVLLSATR